MDDAIKRFRARRDVRLKKRLDEEEWVTIKGTHVMVDDDGQVSKGPVALKGKFKYTKAKKEAGPQNGEPSKAKKKSGGGDGKDLKKKVGGEFENKMKEIMGKDQDADLDGEWGRKMKEAPIGTEFYIQKDGGEMVYKVSKNGPKYWSVENIENGYSKQAGSYGLYYIWDIMAEGEIIDKPKNKPIPKWPRTGGWI